MSPIVGFGDFTLSNDIRSKVLIIFFTDVETDFDVCYKHVLWIKMIALKVNIFVWRLMQNRISTKDSLHRRHILDVSDVYCSTVCSSLEDIHHLFTNYVVFGVFGIIFPGG